MQTIYTTPMIHIHRGVLCESTYRDEDPERATQPEAVSVVRRRTVPWTYCRSTNTREPGQVGDLGVTLQIPEWMRFQSSSIDSPLGYFCVYVDNFVRTVL